LNTLQEKMEKEVIALIFRDYPDLRDQILKARVTSREFTGVGFFTNYHKKDVLSEKNMTISSVVGVILNNRIEVGFVFFITKEEGSALEGYTYGDPFPDQIESYEAFIYEEDENHMLVRPH
jgi:hypothetical protein